MKKIVNFLILVFILICPVFVSALEYQTKQLIPIDTAATVNAEKFSYQDFVYNSAVDEKGNSKIVFNSIQNNTMSKIPVSINLLLFGEDQKNIGIVTYCSDRDYDSNYTGFKLTGNQSAPFSINVTSKYIIENKAISDVKYVAVLDDNKYCKVGGYDNYAGLTIDEIANGITANKVNQLSINKYFESFKESGFISIAFIILVIVGAFVIYGMILSSLYKKMYAKTTILSYLPIANIYITYKLVFGNIIALVGLVINVIAIVLYLLGISFVSYIVSFLDGITFVLVLIKLFSKKYDLFYMEPSIKTSNLNNNTVDNSDNNTTTSDNSFLSDDNQEVLDLSYDDADNVSFGNINDANAFDISSGEAVNNDKEETLDDTTNNNEEEKKEDESDLTKFFG